MKRTDCTGCINELYHSRALRCWAFKEAVKSEFYLISKEALPPYKNLMVKSLPCCFRKDGYIKIKPNQIDDKGKFMA